MVLLHVAMLSTGYRLGSGRSQEKSCDGPPHLLRSTGTTESNEKA